MAYNILLVDDDPFILQTIGPALESEGYRVVLANDGDTAVEHLRQEAVHLVITDLIMDKIDGLDVLKKARRLHPNVLVIILTGYGDMTSAIDALRLKADDYLLKPCEPEELFSRVARCLKPLELERDNAQFEKAMRQGSLSREEVSLLMTHEEHEDVS